MKHLILSIVVTTTFLFSCEREQRCVSCIAETNSGKIVKYVTECHTDNAYLIGFTEGLKQYYKDNGDTVTVLCTYK